LTHHGSSAAHRRQATVLEVRAAVV
jgi:hypothetical protein